MNKLVFTPLLLVAGACMMQQQPAEMSGQAQSQLAAETASRVAGPPQNCVSQRDLTGNRSIGEGAIVFRTQSSDLIYVNRPPAGCPETGIGGTLVTRTTGAPIWSGSSCPKPSGPRNGRRRTASRPIIRPCAPTPITSAQFQRLSTG